MKMPRLMRSLRPPFAAGDDDVAANSRKRPVTGRLKHVFEDVLALAARCRAQRCPCRSLAVALDQPRQRSADWCARLRARLVDESGLILFVKLRRAI
jgi:hypothetical protein